MSELIIPWPDSRIAILWFALGLQFGRSFGKKLDHEIQQGRWFKKRKPWARGLIKRLLDFTHHWWIGYIIWCYAATVAVWIRMPQSVTEISWFGLGLLVDDLPDFYLRIRSGYKNIQAYMTPVSD